jgi:mono/diheme cytochrome c family protein
MRWTTGLVLATGLFAGMAAQSAKTTQDGVYTAEQAKRGEATYTSTCAGCHGPDLMGLDTAPSLTGTDFNTSWNDQTADDLEERIRISMPADKPGSLSREQVADVIAFLFAKDGFPPGSAELPSASDQLKQIKIQATKH